MYCYNYFFYGFADESEKHLERWLIGDFSKFRHWFFKQLWLRNRALEAHIKKPGTPLTDPPWTIQRNHDGSSGFMSLDATKVTDFIIASELVPKDLASVNYEIFKKIPLRQLNEYIDGNTVFDSWDEMFGKATERYLRI